jgi:predicted amidohydrolase
MKIALVQNAPHLGNIEKNFITHLQNIEEAKIQNVDLIVFPELSMTGYTIKDLVGELTLKPETNPLFKRLKTLSKNISIVFGFIEEKERGIFYNSSAFLSGGKILHIHRKVFLPTFGMFEEAKFFAQGKNFISFSSPFGKTGMMICRDFLSYGAAYLLFAGGAEIIIVTSAAPGRGFSDKESFSSSRMWEVMGESISRFSNAFLIYCNRVGFEDGKQFAGGSFIYSPTGQLIAQAPYMDSCFLVQDIDLSEIRESRKNWPFKRDDKPEVILECLKRIVRNYED